MFPAVYFSIGLITFSYLLSICLCGNLYESLAIKLKHAEIARNFSEAIADIVRIYFVGKHQRVAFNYQMKVKCLKNSIFFEKIMEDTVELLGDDIAVTLKNEGPIAEANEMHFSILMVDSWEAVEFFYSNIMKYNLYISGSFFIVLHSLCSSWHYYDDMSAILSISWNTGISHADVLVYGVTNDILLFHGIPFSKFHCHTNLPEIHNKFIDGQWQHHNFYVSKAINVYGCPLIISTWEDMPYFRIHPLSKPEKPIFQGLEGRLLEYLQQRMNFNVTFRWLTEEQINRTAYDQHGLLKELFETGSDIALAAFHIKTTKREDPYASTVSFYPSTYYFVVSSKTDPYKPFEKLLLPFGMDVWGVLILLCICGNIIIYTFSHMNNLWQLLILGRRNNSPYYNLLVVLFGGPVVQDPKVSFSRFLLMVWLFNMTTVRTVYQSLMYHVIKHDLHKQPPKYLRDLKSGYTILMSETVYKYIENFKWLRENANFLNDSVLDSLDILRDPSVYAPRKYAILTAFEYFGYYAYTHNGVKNFHLIPQVLFTQQLSVYMKKNSVYLNRFNIYIDSFINEGLMNRWERVLISNDRFYRRFGHEAAKPMNIRELFGAINLLVIGLAVCLIVFVGELAVLRFKHLHRYWSEEMRKRREIREREMPFAYVE